MEQDRKDIDIEFVLRDRLGCKFSAHSETDVAYDLGEDELSVIGELLNTFLKQCGYYRENQYILMESLTEEELEYLSDQLYEYRKGVSAS